MKKLIGIGVALALLTMMVVPGAVAAQDEPDTYIDVPFWVVGEGIELVGELLDMEEAKMGFIGYDLGQFFTPIAAFTEGPMTWTVDMLGWGVDVIAQVAGPVIDNFAPDYGWIVEVLNTLACKFYMPFGTIEGECGY